MRAKQCKTCQHHDRTRIELLLASGASARAVARKFGLERGTVTRHWANHVSDERKAALIAGPDAKLHELRERAADESISLLDHYRIVRSALYQSLDLAQRVGDRNGVAVLAGRIHENLAGVARLTGELSSIGTVNLNVVQLFESPAFAALQSELIATLRDHPSARLAVIDALRRLECGAPAALPAPPPGKVIDVAAAEVVA